MAKALEAAQVRAWAAVRLSELNQERAALLQLFPGLSEAPRVSTTPDTRRRSRGPADRRRSNMSAAARRAVSKRMKQYWAERRKQKDGARKTHKP